MILLIVLLSLFVIGLIFLIVFGLVVKRRPGPPINLNAIVNPPEYEPMCTQQRIHCKVDDDCRKCAEVSMGEDLKCYTVNKDVDPKTGKMVTENICATTSPDQVCNSKYGGIPILVADGVNKTTWQCECQWPDWTVNPSCSLSPVVCNGGTFDWTVEKGAPKVEYCQCPTNLSRMAPDGKPICVENPGLFKKLKLE